jgi:glutamate formiminotransferase
VALVECVPNFRQGRRKTVIDAIQAAIAAQDVYVLDISSDPDHNRTVITFVGKPDAVLEAIFRGAAVAVAQIDLDEHRGVHPRMGAIDVIPFVPLRDLTIADCVEMAERLGQRVGDELGIPVYLYEAAARRPERVNLADVRRGGYAALKMAIETDPLWMPDFGPAHVGRAGAMIIGARGPLIAFNAYLNTDDVEIAQQIAVSIRESGGGLPFLKAQGLLVAGQTQVSMNVTDFRRTSLYVIMEALRAEARKHGVTVTHTELIGLTPQAALIDCAVESLGLPPQARSQVLERRLGAAMGDYGEVPFD